MAARQAPLSMGLSRQEYWSGLPIPFSRGSSQPRDQTQVSHVAGTFFTIWATRAPIISDMLTQEDSLKRSSGKKKKKERSSVLRIVLTAFQHKTSYQWLKAHLLCPCSSEWCQRARLAGKSHNFCIIGSIHDQRACQSEYHIYPRRDNALGCSFPLLSC